MHQGCRWTIRNGLKVKIWDDPWLRDSNTHVRSAVPLACKIWVVNTLFEQDGMCWNIGMIMSMFDERDVPAILIIPPLCMDQEDVRVWN